VCGVITSYIREAIQEFDVRLPAGWHCCAGSAKRLAESIFMEQREWITDAVCDRNWQHLFFTNTAAAGYDTLPELRSIARIHRLTPLSAGIAISRQITRVFWLKPFSPFIWQPFHHLATPPPPPPLLFFCLIYFCLTSCVHFIPARTKWKFKVKRSTLLKRFLLQVVDMTTISRQYLICHAVGTWRMWCHGQLVVNLLGDLKRCSIRALISSDWTSIADFATFVH
jgi:hypothetical protein